MHVIILKTINMETDSHNKSIMSTHSGEDRFAVMKEINQLRDMADKQLRKNLAKCEQLFECDIDLEFPIITTINISRQRYIKDNEIETEKTRLLAVIDSLMVQQNKMERVQRVNEAKIQQATQRKKLSQAKFMNDYSSLRRLWTQGNYEEQQSAADQIDRINNVIYTLRNGLSRSLIVEKKRSKQSAKHMTMDLLNTKGYELLKEKYQTMKMYMQQVHLRYAGIWQIQLKQRQLLEKENQVLRDEISEQKSKIKKLEKQIITNQARFQDVTDRYNRLNKLKIKKIFRNGEHDIVIREKQDKDECAFQLIQRTTDQILQYFQNQIECKQVLPQSVADIKQCPQQQQIQQKRLPTEMRARRSSSIRVQYQITESDITNIKFTRTNNGLSTARKPRYKQSIPSHFFTKMQGIDNVEL